MSKYEAGFLGAGNMGGALAAAAARQVTGERVAVSCSTPAHSAAAAERLERTLGADKKIIRILPNTPCAVGQGVVLYCANARVTDDDLAAFCALMADAGIVDPVPEHLVDAGCAITGCGPAFAYMFMEALADGGVKCGLPRAKAIRYAAQMLAGSAEMVLQSGKHPEQLKDDVCSPGGSTIAGVDALEQRGFRGSCIAAVDAAFEKTRQLG